MVRNQPESDFRAFYEAANDAHKIFEEFFDRIGRDDTSRDSVAQFELLVLDLLKQVLRPIVSKADLPGYIRQYIDFGSLVGAGGFNPKGLRPSLLGIHFRSEMSSQGRGAAFVGNHIFEERLVREIAQRVQCADQPIVEALGSTLWHATLQEVYFFLFDKRWTVNEWILEDLRDSCKGFYLEIDDHKELRAECHTDSQIIIMKLPDSNFAEPLLPRVQTSRIWLIVVESLATAIREARDLAPVLQCDLSEAYFERIKHQGPDRSISFLSKWIVRSAFQRSYRRLRALSIQETCQELSRFFTSKLLLERRDEAECLLRASRVDLASVRAPFLEHHERLLPIVQRLQGLKLYCDLFGKSYLSIPFWLKDRKVPGSSISIIFKSRVLNGKDAADITSAVARYRKLAGPLVRNSMLRASLIARSYYRAAPLSLDGKEGLLRWPSIDSLQVIAHEIQERRGESAQEMNMIHLEYLLALVMNLAGARHEGAPVEFSFVLGPPQSLIVVPGLKIAHEFLKFRKESGRWVPLLQLGHTRLDFSVCLSIIRGNFNLLQSTDSALFLSHPASPPEITHIVRFQNVEGMLRTRKAFLKEMSRYSMDVVAGLATANGNAEIYHSNQTIFTYSRNKGGWFRGVDFSLFWKGIEAKLGPMLGILDAQLAEWLRLITQLISDSPRDGAIIVLAKTSGIVRLKEHAVPMTEVFDSVDGRPMQETSVDLLYRVATEDGAILIDTQVGKVYGRWQLPVVDPRRKVVRRSQRSLYELWQEPASRYYWPEWFKTLSWGSRHMAALSASLLVGVEGLVIVVSADGPIHLLQDGRSVAGVD